MDLNLRGQSVLITGASRGIGRAIAEVMAEEGCTLHLAARDGKLLDSVCAELSAKYKVETHAHAHDLSITEEVEKLGAACIDVDILVNNAGAIPRGPISEISGQTWRKAWDLKVFGFIDLTRIVFARMCERGRGAIVNVIGMAGERPDWKYIAGSAGNAALNSFTLSLGGESVRYGVRVNCVNPGPIMSDRFKEGILRRARLAFNDENRWPELLQDLPIKRAGTPKEVADSVAFLASERASYISGAALRIDAGLKHRSPDL
jgi:NAD(P)-dependent dehydrogenase (short-subunit alcohol dehydrogenase family)